MYVNCFPLHFCCLQLVTKAMLLYNSAICDLLRESIQIMKILIHLKVVILVSEKWNEHNLMYINHKQCEIMQKVNETAQTPTSLISHWFSVEIVHYGPKLCQRKRVFLYWKKYWDIQGVPCESWRTADFVQFIEVKIQEEKTCWVSRSI